MSDLINKYRKDELTPKELSELKQEINAMPDAEIEEKMHAFWLNDNIDTSAVSDELMKRIKNNCDKNIRKKRNRFPIFIRYAQIASLILLPLFIAFTIYLYQENSIILSDEMLVTTGKTERATITLPDGTIVSLNSESTLRYLPKDYNKEERKIKFSGEGYFRVHNNKEVPFLINAKGLEVRVLGTIFNLSVRDNDKTAVLSLEEGSVLLVSERNNTNVTLKKDQKAILDRSTGKITVISDENIKDVSAWRRGDMVFRNTPLSGVIHTIEENYNVTIIVDCKDCLEDSFTGILPTNNLNEVLEVIEHSYHLKAVITGKEIVLK